MGFREVWHAQMRRPGDLLVCRAATPLASD